MQATEPARFEGDFSSFWHLDTLPPLRRLSWWWWWWLVLIPDPERPGRSKQLMVLWSTRDCERINVSGYDWWGGGRTAVDDEGGIVFPGMIASWWFDGETVHEPIVLEEARMAAMNSGHSLWPGGESRSGGSGGRGDGESRSGGPASEAGGAGGSDGRGEGDSGSGGSAVGGGAVVPISTDDLSMGMAADSSHFWLKLSASEEAKAGGSAAEFDFIMKPWNDEISALEYKHNMLAGKMGYDILRIHGTKCEGTVDGEPVEGTAYFQKVCVQAPSIPWFWGMLHFENGSYLDWFLPHYSFSMTAQDDRPWKLRDVGQLPIQGAGLWKDAGRQRTEQFERCEVELIKPPDDEALFDGEGNPLPRFHIRMWNGRTQIGLVVAAVGRARWTFDQPTRAHMTSHFTYNEYPLKVEEITVLDEKGVRTLDDWQWIHGNAEHSWGVLH